MQFGNLSHTDSRNLALDWILNKDEMKRNASDFNLSHQRYILAMLAYEFGTSFQSSTNWLSNVTECSWSGVTCDKKHVVSKLELGKSIPESIISLAGIRLS
jgi:hypothetical protein